MYVKRNATQQITAVSQVIDGDINEFISSDSLELLRFLNGNKDSQLLSLERSDQAMARVLDDVINLLVDQGTIRFTDLPDAAQTKLLSRREWRGQRKGIDLLDNGDDDLNI
ncbi:MAG TPA: hypothetical protein VN030_13350 [Cellvibrio sp.]|nr:hypothetical protein [Cellvibrio sp.]